MILPSRWKSCGYWYVSDPTNIRYIRGVPEHKIFWEIHHKACVLPWGVVHHIDGNRSNNDISNLQAMMRKNHTSLHQKGISKHKGRKLSEETKRKISESMKAIRNPQWKGDGVDYIGLRKWIKRNLPKPDLCEECYQNMPSSLINLTGIYNRSFDNWRWVCIICYKSINIVLGGKKR